MKKKFKNTLKFENEIFVGLFVFKNKATAVSYGVRWKFTKLLRKLQSMISI